MRDGVIRSNVKRLSRWVFRLDRWLTDLFISADRTRLFELRGHCVRCGACCESPMIAVTRLVYFSRSLRRLFLAWQKHINGFHYIDEDRASHSFVFRCEHFQPESCTCDCYASRPLMCREYPEVLLQAPNPEFLEGCGFRAVYRYSDAMRDALADAGVSPEKIEELAAKLRLEDAPPPRARGDGDARVHRNS